MTTVLYEAYSIEEGDTLLIQGNLFAVSQIDDIPDGFRLHLTDEEGYAKILMVNDTDRLRVVCEMEEVEA